MSFGITPAFIGGVPGGTELVVILLIAVLLFGANKIPKLARSTGQAMGEFQRGREEIEQELEEMQNPTQGDSDSSTATSTESTATSTSTETETSTDRDSGTSSN